MSRTLAPARPELYETTRLSLLRVPKELPPIWLYDERGSLLYEEITRLPDYYLPARETEILRAHARAIAERTEAKTLVELGAGNGRRTRFLLDALTRLERFVPVDVSEEILRETARTVADDYPEIEVDEHVGDFERDLGELPGPEPRLIAILGSTIGNLYPERRAELLGALEARMGEEDAFLLGIDLVKDTARLQAAYDDDSGVTEAFVRNALTAVNRELDATFDQERFAYEPVWDPSKERMDIGLRALQPHTVQVERLGLDLAFTEGERLRVEVSSKFRRESFAFELRRAGLRLDAWWTDSDGDFAVLLARPEGRPDV